MATEPDIEKAAAQARSAVRLAMLCVIVAVIVLIIDHGIKRHIIAKSNEARAILEEFRVQTGQVMNGQTGAAQPGPDSSGSADLGGGGDAGGVQPAAPAGEVVGQPGGDSEVAPVSGRAGGAGGPRGHG